MAIGRIDDSLLYDIADAIRDKNSSTETYLPSEMPAAITAIETGVDTSDATVTPEDMAEGVIAYGADGAPITGNVKNVNSGIYLGWTNRTPTISTGSSSTGQIGFEQKVGEPNHSGVMWRNGSYVRMVADPSKFGTATTNDVVSGKTFTSVAGLKADGGLTEVPSGTKIYGDNSPSVTLKDGKIETIGTYGTAGSEGGIVVRPGGLFGIRVSADQYGDATEDDVVSGKTFTSKDGFQITGKVGETNSGNPYQGIATTHSLFTIDSVGYYLFKHTATKNRLIRSETEVYTFYPRDNFGDAAAKDVVSGKYFTSKNGFNIKGTHVCPAGLDTNTTKAPSSTDMATGKEAWANGTKITGSLPVRCSDMGYDLTTSGASAVYINNSSGDNYVRFSYTPTTKVIIDTAYPLQMGSLASNFGDATPNDVVSGKYFTSENGLKKKGTHVCSAGLDTTTDKEPASTDIVSGKEAWANGSKITGSLTEYTSGQMATTKLESVSGGSTFSVTGTIQEDGVFRKGAVIRQWITPTKFGTATVNDVANGVTFTSENGIEVKGTHVCPAGLDTTASPDVAATENDIAYGKIAWVNGEQVTGMAPRIEFCTVTIKKTQNTYYPYRVYHTDASSENLMITTPDSLYDKSSYQMSCVKGTYILIDCGDNQVSGHNITISGNLEADVAATYSTGWVVHIRNFTNSNIIGDSVTITVS